MTLTPIPTAANASPDGVSPLAEMMQRLGAGARAAYQVVAQADAATKNRALHAAAAAIRAEEATILAANGEDMRAATEKGLSAALLDRLQLTPARVEAMASGLVAIAELPDPVGRELAEWERPNGLRIRRVSVPLGVIGIIYESRPNVTVDASGLAIKAGNAAILRGGSESFHSSRALVACLHHGLKEAGLPAEAVQLVPTTDRAAVTAMLHMVGVIDIIVPRGGKSLTEKIQAESRIPTLQHLDGNCHTYIHHSADPAMAQAVVMNAKLRRTGVCGATETLLVDRAALTTHLPPLLAALLAAGCEIRGDAAVQALDARVKAASEDDWSTEFLAPILAIKTVENIDDAIAHIHRYGSHHTEAIIAEDAQVAERFLREVDSAIVLVNASTQFADGGEFGMGAEIGIATGRLHARGPVGAEQLTTYKYMVLGTGQVRPG